MADLTDLVAPGITLAALGTALWRGWIVPRPTVDREHALRKEISDMRAEEARVSRELAERMRLDNVALTEQLTQAIRREYRAAGAPVSGS